MTIMTCRPLSIFTCQGAEPSKVVVFLIEVHFAHLPPNIPMRANDQVPSSDQCLSPSCIYFVYTVKFVQ